MRPRYRPLRFPRLVTGDYGIFHDIRRDLPFGNERPVEPEYLFIAGNLTGALVTLMDLSACRIVVDRAPAILYAIPSMPELRRDGEMLKIGWWPKGQPIASRIAHPSGRPWLLPPHSYLQIRFDDLAPNPAGLDAVLLCRPLSDAELAR